MSKVKDTDLERRVYLSFDNYRNSAAFFASVVCGEGGSAKLKHYAAFSTLLYMFETLTLAKAYNKYFNNQTMQTIESGLTVQFDELRFKFLSNLLD